MKWNILLKPFLSVKWKQCKMLHDVNVKADFFFFCTDIKQHSSKILFWWTYKTFFTYNPYIQKIKQISTLNHMHNLQYRLTVPNQNNNEHILEFEYKSKNIKMTFALYWWWKTIASEFCRNLYDITTTTYESCL